VNAGTVHVWVIDLDSERESLASMLELLSGEERIRAARLHTTELRVRFVVAHGALRTILSRYLAVPAAAVRLETMATGRPLVRGGAVSFNLSHCEGLALVAVSPGTAVGVDLERIRTLADADAIVARFFSANEGREYAALGPGDRPRAFFSIWTRKEAFVKGTGEGLGRALKSFDVDVDPGLAAPRVSSLSPDVDAAHWRLRSFTPRPGYIAALAVHAEITSLDFFEWTAASRDMPLPFSGPEPA